MLVITDRYFKQSKAISIFVARDLCMMINMFFDHWIVPFEIPTHILTDNRPEFADELYQYVSRRFEIEHFTTTLYHPQNSKQAESFNKNIVIGLRHFSKNTSAKGTCSFRPLHMCTVHRYTGVQKLQHTSLYWVDNHIELPFWLQVETQPMAVQTVRSLGRC